MNQLTMSAPEQAIMAELRGFRELMEERTDNLAKTLDLVRLQCEKTNGRVTKLEIEAGETRGKAKVSGILWGGLVSIGVSVVAFFVNNKV